MTSLDKITADLLTLVITSKPKLTLIEYIRISRNLVDYVNQVSDRYR